MVDINSSGVDNGLMDLERVFVFSTSESKGVLGLLRVESCCELVVKKNEERLEGTTIVVVDCATINYDIQYQMFA